MHDAQIHIRPAREQGLDDVVVPALRGHRQGAERRVAATKSKIRPRDECGTVALIWGAGIKLRVRVGARGKEGVDEILAIVPCCYHQGSATSDGGHVRIGSVFE